MPTSCRPPRCTEVMAARKVLVYGLGVSGVAAVRHLVGQGVDVVGVDDATATRPEVTGLGIDVVLAPTETELTALAREVEEIVVSPGVPARHPVFHLDA